MGFLDIFKRRDPRLNYDLQPKDKALGGDSTRLKWELNRQKHDYEMALEKLEYEKRRLQLENDISNLQSEAEEMSEDYPDEENSAEDKILGAFLAQIMAKNQTQTAAPQAAADPEVPLPPGEPTDADLRVLWRKLPQNVKDQAQEMMKK